MIKDIRQRKKKKIVIITVVIFVLIVAAFILPVSIKTVLEWKKDNSVVAVVNSEPVTYRELMREVNKNIAEVYAYFKEKYGVNDSKKFWESRYGGEVPIDKIRKDSLDECVKIKVQEILAEQKGIVKDISYSNTLKSMEDENRRRKTAIENNRVVYGPVSFDEEEYFEYFFSNMIQNLKNNMGKSMDFSDKAMEDYYDLNREMFKKPFAEIKIKKIFVPNTDKDGNRYEDEYIQSIIREIMEKLNCGETFESVQQFCNEKYGSVIDTGERVFDQNSKRVDVMENPTLVSEVDKLTVGQVSGVIAEKIGYYIVKCTEKFDGGYLSLQESKEKIKTDLIDEQYEKMVDNSIKTAKVEINERNLDKVKLN